MNNHNEPFGYIGNAIGAVFSAIQTNEVLSWISWGLTILATLISVAYTIYKWWDKAHADGKITPDEIKDLSDDLNEEMEKMNNGKK